jgi:hypothetical protein
MKWKLSDSPDLARKNAKPSSLDSLTGEAVTPPIVYYLFF